ncbi:uncharacterized protein B4U80_00168 [Leptotrombidium deliense]|uniref:Peptidase M28 domain-containing protein n=1 Tax=Leptotrombidium deliense TaxID=299467 RepID=A0A443RXX8_9ACAR|nr:uncharacterized protein B4U80_00168 [Leptotrombidium deliense]
MLEIARVLRFHNKLLNHTIIFVAFDLEESGVYGSIAFVCEYLIPKEIQERGVKFIGSYVFDMVLNYDTKVNSQTLPEDFADAIPNITAMLHSNQNRGNFIAAWTRFNVDTPLFTALSNAWTKSEKSSIYKLIEFAAPFPATNTFPEMNKYPTFTRSDHASFWFHDGKSYAGTLRAVLLTDMGPWRGVNMQCYHAQCDDNRRLTNTNLEFLKHTIQALLTVLTNITPISD